MITQFTNYVQELKKNTETNEDTKEAFYQLYQLCCLSLIEADLGTFREGDFMTSD